MKNILSILFTISVSAMFSQITITSNIPTNFAATSVTEAEVKINKGTVSNFAKYQMDIPAGFVVSASDAKGGNFTFENQRAKIVWVSVPGDAEFSIKFKIQANSDAASGTISQKFFYLENNEKKEVEAAPLAITVGGGGAVAVVTPVETVKETPAEVVKTNPVETNKETPVEVVTESSSGGIKETPVEVVTPTPVEVVKTTQIETVKTTQVETVITTPNNTGARASSTSTSLTESGMTFKVQLGAFSSEPNKKRFASAGNVSVELINGVYKVTTGNFNSKEAAINFMNELKGKGYQGFIAKYKNGQRIN